MTDYKSNVVDLDLFYVSETEKGLAVRLDEGRRLIWLPKSQIEYEQREYKRHEVVKVTIPEWLAVKHDLV
jgi:hypothetical protein